MADDTAELDQGKIVNNCPTQALFGNVTHPYTKALFSAVLPPRPGRSDQEIVLAGEVPSPLNPPSGCRFHTRCPFAFARCSQEEPEMREVLPGHRVACHLRDAQIPAFAQAAAVPA